jgi:hypothetical protein
VQQEHLNHDVVFDMVIRGSFIPLFDHDRVGPALAGFPIHRREHILTRRDTARKVERTQIATACRWDLIEGL